MKYIFGIIIRSIVKMIVWIWDFIFFFFGMTYEKQASKLKLDKLDPIIRGHENEKTTHKIYRANKVGNNTLKYDKGIETVIAIDALK